MSTSEGAFPMRNKILLAALVSWIFSITLGLLFATTMSGRFIPNVIALPGVVRVALTIGTAAALLMTPIAVWAARTGTKNLWTFAPVLWLGLAAYIGVIIPRLGSGGIYGLLPLAVIGLVLLGAIAPRN